MIEKKHRAYTRDDVIETIRRLPEHATIDDALERLLFIQSLERGIAAAEAGDVVSQDEVEREMAEWTHISDGITE